MQIITSSKARSGQPPDRVASPGQDSTKFPRRLSRARQGIAVLVNSAGVGGPSISEPTASGVHQVAGCRLSKCSSARIIKKD